MKDSLLIKSNKHGITIHFNPDLPFEQLLQEVYNKFLAGRNFFNEADMIVEFADRSFTNEEEQKIAEAIEEAGKIHIICIIKQQTSGDIIYRRMRQEYMKAQEEKDGQFYKGTLREKQILESDKSIVIIGDIMAGAKVISKGNVVVTGTIEGSVTAGASGNYHAVIAALHMRPERLRIGDIEVKPVIGGSYSWAKLL